MRIVHAILSMTSGGAERQLAKLAPELARRGHDVHLVFVRGGVHEEGLRESGCTLHRLERSFKQDPRLLTRAISLLRRLRPDVVQTWLTHMDLLGGAAASLLRLPWVVSERSAADCYEPTLLNRMRAAAGRRADVIVANSEGGARYWRSQGADPARIQIVPNFVLRAEIESAEPLADPRIAADDELVLHVGRLSREKNLGTLVTAFQHVLRARPRAKLALCGEGPLRGELAAQVRAAGIDDRVIFAGFVPDVASWLKRANALAAVSRYEGHPNAVLEAVAAGVPVVLSDNAAYRAVLRPDAALFVPTEDALALAGALVSTLEDRDAAAARAARARAVVLPLSIESTAARYEEIYRLAVASRETR